jgi:hypothetical protein
MNVAAPLHGPVAKSVSEGEADVKTAEPVHGPVRNSAQVHLVLKNHALGPWHATIGHGISRTLRVCAQRAHTFRKLQHNGGSHEEARSGVSDVGVRDLGWL